MYEYIKNKETGAISRVNSSMTGIYLGLGTFIQTTKSDYDIQQNATKNAQPVEINITGECNSEKSKSNKK